jgi:N utilization substance protein B
MRARRISRQRALQVLCAIDSQPGLSPAEALTLYHRHLLSPESEGSEGSEESQGGEGGGTTDDVEEPVRAYCKILVSGVRNELEEIDAILGRCSRNWRLQRMNWVDRNVLRLATWELRHGEGVPARVVLNEAIELARRYGTTESAAFVNGVLDRVLADLGRTAPGSGPR